MDKKRRLGVLDRDLARDVNCRVVFCLLLHTWLSIYKRLIALALAGGSGTEHPASDRIARGHSERLNSRLKTVEQVTARWKMFCMNQSAVVVKTH